MPQNEVKLIITADNKGATAGIKGVESSLQGMSANTSSLVSQIKTHWFSLTAGITGAIFSIRQAFNEFEASVLRQEKVLAFDNLAISVGQNAQSIINDVRAAAGEMLSMQKTIEITGRAMLLGLEPESITRLMEVARASAKVTGQTIEQAFGDITLGVARQSKMILDNLGILLDYDKELRNLQDALGKTESQLTDAERRQAFLNATFEAGEKIINRVGTGTASLNDLYQQQKALLSDNLTNLRDMVFQSRTFVDLLAAINDNLKVFVVVVGFAAQELRDMWDALKWVASPLASFWGLLRQGSQIAGDALDKLLGYNQAITETQRLIKNAPQNVGQLGFSFPSEFSAIPQRAPTPPITMSQADIDKWLKEQAEFEKSVGEAFREEGRLAEEARRRDEEAAKRRQEVYRDMYEALRFDTERYYEFQKGLLEQQREEEIAVTGDIQLAWEAFYARLRELEEERILRTNDFVGGIKVFYSELEREGFTWAQGSRNMMRDWKSGMESELAGFLNTAETNWDNLGDAFKDMLGGMLEAMRNAANQMIAEWAIKGLFSLFGSFFGAGLNVGASSMGGTSSGAGSWGLASGSYNPSPFAMQGNAALVPQTANSQGTVVVQQTVQFNVSTIDEQGTEQFFRKNSGMIQKVVGEGVDRSRAFAAQLRGNR